MSWTAIIFWVIMHLPEILSLIEKIIHGGSSEVRAQARTAISAAIQTGDVQQVKDTVDVWHGKCHSSMCVPDLVGND